MEFVFQRPVRFADVDAAGIVYYPNFFHYYHSAFEELFAVTHELSYHAWLEQRRRGFPTVHVVADFHAPLRYGETLRVTVTVARLGNRSVDFHFAVRGDGEDLRADATITKACVDLDTLASCPVPAELRVAWGGAGS